MSRRRFPLSLWLIAATAVLAAAQLIVDLSAMLAVFWPMLLVNAAMIGILAESVGGLAHRRWLAIPALFYIGYAAWAVIDGAAIGAALDEAQRRNAQAVAGIDFAPGRDALVLSGDRAAERARWLARHHGVTLFLDEGGKPMRSVRAAGRKSCEALGRQTGRTAAIEPIYEGWLPNAPPAGCYVVRAERPSGRAIRVVFDDDGDGWSRFAATTMWVGSGPAPRVQLIGGVANRLAWFPLPYAGCDRHGRDGARRCGAGFLRLRRAPIATDGRIANAAERLLAEKLRLPETPLR